MKQLGYIVDLNPYHKYATICSVNSKKATCLYRLGEAYYHVAIYDRMRDTRQNNWQGAYQLYDELTAKKLWRDHSKGVFCQRKPEERKKDHRAGGIVFQIFISAGCVPEEQKAQVLVTRNA